MRIAVVKAARDPDARVWYVEHSDVTGLHVEGETFEDFCRNVAGADLLEGDGEAGEIPIEIIAHASLRARVTSFAVRATKRSSRRRASRLRAIR
jgi:Domain of unknown function (DUF1902)